MRRKIRVVVRTSITTGGKSVPRSCGRNSRDVSTVDVGPEFVGRDDDDDSARIRVGNGSGASERTTDRSRRIDVAREREKKRERERGRKGGREKRARASTDSSEKSLPGKRENSVETQTCVPARLVTLLNPIHTETSETRTNARNVMRERQLQAGRRSFSFSPGTVLRESSRRVE